MSVVQKTSYHINFKIHAQSFTLPIHSKTLWEFYLSKGREKLRSQRKYLLLITEKTQFPKVHCIEYLTINCSKYSFNIQNQHLTTYSQTLGSLNSNLSFSIFPSCWKVYMNFSNQKLSGMCYFCSPTMVNGG